MSAYKYELSCRLLASQLINTNSVKEKVTKTHICLYKLICAFVRHSIVFTLILRGRFEREAEKKVILSTPPPSAGLMVIGTFFLFFF